MPTAKVGFIKYPYISYQDKDLRRVPLILSGVTDTAKPYSDFKFIRNPSNENNCVHRKAQWRGSGFKVNDSLFTWQDSVETEIIPKAYWMGSEVHCRVTSLGPLLYHEYCTRNGNPKTTSWTCYRGIYDPSIKGKVGTTDAIQLTCFTCEHPPTSSDLFNWGMIDEGFVTYSEVKMASLATFVTRSCNYEVLDYKLNMALLFDHLDNVHAIPQGLQSQAFRNATDTLRLTTNNIANVADTLSLATSLVSGGPFGAILNVKKEVKALSLGAKLAPTILKDISKRCPGMAARGLLKNQWSQKVAESWLWYRYAYTTTKSDVEEIHSKAGKLNIDQQGWHTVRSCNTTPEGTLHCKASIWKRDSDPASEIAIRLWEYGCQPDAYACWDMVPLSFVVDWFTDIGSRLEDKSSDFIHTSAVFDIPSIVYSWKYHHTIELAGNTLECTSYSRWETTESPQFEYYSEDTSTGTVIRRVLDGAALTLTSARSHL